MKSYKKFKSTRRNCMCKPEKIVGTCFRTKQEHNKNDQIYIKKNTKQYCKYVQFKFFSIVINYLCFLFNITKLMQLHKTKIIHFNFNN